MIFSLEALRALHGDSLLLHFGSTDDPRTVLIDGGPGPVYGQTLKPRLLALRQHLIRLGKIGADDALPLALAQVSHSDADHIEGLLALTRDPGGGLGIPQPCWVQPKTLWHNSFPKLVDDAEVRTAEIAPEASGKTAAALASVKQGDDLLRNADSLDWTVNRPFDGSLVQAPKSGGQSVRLDTDTSLLIVGPRTDEIEALREEWKKQQEKIARRQTNLAAVAAYLDNSPYNLSSIVCLARQGDHTMLLTGDARGDLILKALEAAGVMSNGAIHVNVLKIPHHGSIRDVDTDFFARITADHYVISANGKYGNPETETLEMIAQSRTTDDFTIHLTYATGEGDLEQRLAAFAAARDAKHRTFAIETRHDPNLSLSVDLGDAPFS